MNWRILDMVTLRRENALDRLNRRSFLKAAGAATAGTFAAGKVEMLAQAQSEPSRHLYRRNDHIQIALIGAGGQGQSDAHVALRHPGVKLMARLRSI